MTETQDYYTFSEAAADALYLPKSHFLSNAVLSLFYKSIIAGTWVHAPMAMQVLYLLTSNAPPAQNDEIEYYLFAQEGEKTLSILGSKALNSGIATVYLDDIIQGTFDGYGPGVTLNIFFTLPVTVVNTKTHSLKLKMATKNASSSGYKLSLTALWIK